MYFQFFLTNWKFFAVALALIIALGWFGARKCLQRSALAPVDVAPPEAVSVPSKSDYETAIKKAEQARDRWERSKRR